MNWESYKEISILERILEFEENPEEVQRLTIQISEKKRELKADISLLKNPMLKKIMVMRYLDGLGWWSIAERTGYSADHVRFMGRKARSVILHEKSKQEQGA